jgi:hypothetical protein
MIKIALTAALAADFNEADLKVREAKVILERIMRQGDKSIPTDLIRLAKVVVFSQHVQGRLRGGRPVWHRPDLCAPA